MWNGSETDLFATMTVSPPDVSAATAEAIALQHWGISARAKPLSGERDRNFHLFADDGREYVLKFANPAEKADVRKMQIAALRHLERVDSGLATPRIVPLPDGALEVQLPQVAGPALHARLLTWVAGDFIYSSRRSAAQRVAYGNALARLQLALGTFSHPGADYPLCWDVRQSLRLREISFTIPHAPARALVGELLDEFEARVTPLLPTLRRQVVHNDVHGYNTFVDPANHDRITGVIDFGDMVLTAVVFDLAIAAGSQPAADMRAPEALGHFVDGFHAVRPLLPVELELLPLLIATRTAMGLTLASWHRHAQPDNPHFTLTEERIVGRMTSIAEIRSPEVEATLRQRMC